MKEIGNTKMQLVRGANALMERTKKGVKMPGIGGDPAGRVWASLAKYDDDLVELLERLERSTRDEGHLGSRRAGSDGVGNNEELKGVFKDGKWDNVKMVKTFARMGMAGKGGGVNVEREKVIISHVECFECQC